MKLKKHFLTLGLAVIIITLPYCKKDKHEQPAPDSPSQTQDVMTVTGKVIDETGNVVSGASVQIGSTIATTDGNGKYTLSNAPFNARSFIKISYGGFYDAFRGFKAFKNETNYVDARLLGKGTPQSFNSSTTTTLSNSSGQLIINSNTLADASGNSYNGIVTAYLRFVSPNNANFGSLMQGGDFAGINSTDVTGVLSSFGFFSVELEGSAGEKLNLITGKQSTFSLPISTSQSASASPSISLWTFETGAGIWKEEGTATKVGNEYIGNVSHFSSWNSDKWFNPAYITGKITCNGLPKPNVQITFDNNYYTINTMSSSTGQFSISVPQGFAVVVTIPGSMPINVGPLTPGQVHDIGTIETCAITGTLEQILIGNGPTNWKTFNQSCWPTVCTSIPAEYSFTFFTNHTFQTPGFYGDGTFYQYNMHSWQVIQDNGTSATMTADGSNMTISSYSATQFTIGSCTYLKQ